MPIRRDLRHHYGRVWREEIRPRILARAGGEYGSVSGYLGGAKCEQCGKPDRSLVWSVSGYLGGAKCEQCGKPDRSLVWVWKGAHTAQYWSAQSGAGQLWHYSDQGGATGNFQLIGRAQWREARRTRVILTVAHLNHDPADNRDENLKALCQWCHLNYDKLHHAETRATRKDRARPLLAEVRA